MGAPGLVAAKPQPLGVNMVLFLFAVQNGHDKIEFSLHRFFFDCTGRLDGSDNHSNKSCTPMSAGVLMAHRSHTSSPVYHHVRGQIAKYVTSGLSL